MSLKLYGVDVYILSKELPIVSDLKCSLRLTKMFNRGTQTYPGADPIFHLTDVQQCRFESVDQASCEQKDILALLTELDAKGFEFVQVMQLKK